MKNFSSFCYPWMLNQKRNHLFTSHSNLSEINEEKILRRRLASGEISVEDYTKIMDILKKTKI